LVVFSLGMLMVVSGSEGGSVDGRNEMAKLN
jgi:hypothetical protein